MVENQKIKQQNPPLVDENLAKGAKSNLQHKCCFAPYFQVWLNNCKGLH